MEETLDKLYAKNDDVQCAYLLRSGSVFIELQEGERYEISGANLILGAQEIVNNFETIFYGKRLYTLLKNKEAELSEISPENLKKFIFQYSVGFNLNVFLARLLKILTKVLANRKAALGKDEQEIQRFAAIYFKIAEDLMQLGQRTRFPDVQKAAEKLKNELIYPLGKIYAQTAETVQLDVTAKDLGKFNRIFPAGSTIFEQGKQGNEMYILISGSVDILVNNMPIGKINEAGVVIGEIALLLGDVRTATLRAETETTVSVIKKENLAAFQKSQPDIFLSIAKSISRNVTNNILRIDAIDEQKTATPLTTYKVGGFLTKMKARTLLEEMFRQIFEIQKKKNYPQLAEMMKKYEAESLEFGDIL